MSGDKVDALAVMVSRFLGWRLPDDFMPDAGISFSPPAPEHMPHCWPIGTNLLNAPQAEAMLRHVAGELLDERDRLDALVNNPQTALFLEAVRAEAAHQVERWGTLHDRAKAPADWFWLLGYLSGKALAAHNAGDEFKALHHTISSAAVLANWFAAIKLGTSGMAPSSSDLQVFIDEQFGEATRAALTGTQL